MNNTSITPRIYVASLSDYNAGVLHGAWIDANQHSYNIRAEIAAMLRESKHPNVWTDCPHCAGSGALQPDETCPECNGEGEVRSAEEWAIHDHEGFCGLEIGEHESPEDVASMASAVEEHGEAFVAWHNNAPSYNTDVSDFQEQYAGEWDSLADYAENLTEDCYSDVLKGLPDFIRHNIDWEGIGRDMQLGGEVWTADADGGKVRVFRNV